MSKENPWCLVVGCGKTGAEWVSNHNGGVNYIAVDLKEISGMNGRLIAGDLFSLPFKNQSIDKIHADFALNGLIDRDPNAAAICADPDILDSHYFPPLVRQWYLETVERSADKVRRNIGSVGKLLQITALREMWRVLKAPGNLEILDFDYNINRLVHFAPQLLNENPHLVTVNSLQVTEDDRTRSGSLQKVSQGSTRPQKISLSKLSPYQDRFTLSA